MNSQVNFDPVSEDKAENECTIEELDELAVENASRITELRQLIIEEI